jgi:hypothetical protein
VTKSAKRWSKKVFGGLLKDNRKYQCIGCGRQRTHHAHRRKREDYEQEESDRLLCEERQFEFEQRQRHEEQLVELKRIEQQRAEERKLLEDEIQRQESEIAARRIEKDSEGESFS